MVIDGMMKGKSGECQHIWGDRERHGSDQEQVDDAT